MQRRPISTAVLVGLVTALLSAAVVTRLAAGTLEVTASAAYAGSFGLEAAISPPCAWPDHMELLNPPLTTVAGDFTACFTITVGAVAAVAPGVGLTAGDGVLFGNDFVVEQAADLDVAIDPSLTTRLAAVTDETPSTTSYRARFHLRVDALRLSDTAKLNVFTGHPAGTAALFRVTVKRNVALGENRLVVSAREDDGSYAELPFGEELLLPAGWNRIEVTWRAGAGDGEIALSLNNAPFVGLSDLDNDSFVLERVRLGIASGMLATSTGSIQVDVFESGGGAGGGEAAGCQVLPPDNVWNVPVDGLPLDPNSAAYVQTIGAAATMHPDFGSGEDQGSPIGIPWTDVPGSEPKVSVTFDYAGESDPGPYPISSSVPIEGGSDHHALIVDRDACVLYELYDVRQVGGNWEAGSGAVFDLGSHALRPDGWTSADAAGLPILPGLARYEEVAAGEIRHALRFTAPQTRNAYVWPARHEASSLSGLQYPPMGQRFRLRSDYDLSGFSADSRVILQALKTYGMMLADNGSSWYLSGAPDEGWDNDVLQELKTVAGSSFEAVDVSSLRIDPDSGQTAAAVFTDGFESGDLSAWSAQTP